MALPSQVARPTTGRLATGLSRPRTRPGSLRRPLIVLAVLALAAITVWTLARPASSTKTAPAPKQAAETSKTPRKSAAATTGMGPGTGRLADLVTNAPENAAKTPASAPTQPAAPVVEMAPRSSLGASDAVQPGTTTTPPVRTPTPATTPGGMTPPTTSEPVEPRLTEAAPVRSSTIQSLIDQGESALARNALIEARDAFNRAFYAAANTPSDQDFVRGKLSTIADKVTFSPMAYPGDDMASTYEIAGGDNLNRISREQNLKVDWRFIQRINQISDPRRIRVGQKIKLLQGPFHVIVDKSDFRMDLFADAKDTAGNRLFLRSFRVGLGEAGSTPLGHWVVRPQSKLVDPAWVNPRTGESFTADDPLNPIGERWVGIDGVDDSNRDKVGFGIHGTIDPNSIGKEMSMGCVRMDAPDIELVYELLIEGGTEIEIRP